MPKLFVFAGPSGVGKSYVMEQLIKQYPDRFVIPKLLTTRLPRPGEAAQDRQFISLDEFKACESRGELVIAEEFNGNWYGCRASDLQSKDKHVLVNIWPGLIPRLSAMPHVVFIGMTVTGNGIALLASRIKTRADSPTVFDQRMARVRVDLADLKTYRSEVERTGKMFSIVDDSTAELIIEYVLAEAR